jgi:hypothetical protein
VNSSIAKENGWPADRFEQSIKKLVEGGLVWVDRQTEDRCPRYYFPEN